MVLQTCHEKQCSGLIKSLHLDSLICETVSPRTRKSKIVNKSLFRSNMWFERCLILVWLDSLQLIQQFFSPVGTGET